MRPGLRIIGFVSVVALTGAGNNADNGLRPERSSTVADSGLSLADPVYDNGLKGEWQDFGWSRRDINGPGAARIEMSGYGGWIVAKPGLQGRFEALVFRVKAAPTSPFLSVALSAGKNNEFPDVLVTGKYLRAAGSELEALIPLKDLNPENKTFDRIVFRSAIADAGWVQIEGIGLWALGATAKKDQRVKAAMSASKQATLAVACSAPAHTVDPMVFGIAYYPMSDYKDQHVWSMNPGARRWGGNHTSRYNWRLGNAWNTASDWFFKNVNYTGDPKFNADMFLNANRQHGVRTALSVPMIGWVAKDTSSYAFPVSASGQQKAYEPGFPDVGNGVKPDGTPLKPGPQSRTSVTSKPEDITAWVEHIRDGDTVAQARRVHQYILDNEPDLWHTTHRDVHPEPASYDELLERTIAYGDAIRRADPNAVIAGPASWGWTGYFYSAADQVAGFANKPDRRKHGDVPFLAWYLRELRAHEQRTGQRVLDVLDIHFYPQGDNIYGGNATDPETAARRVRATRALWDPSYKDESWIADTIQLLPRMQKLIDENYPGTRLSIGEWSFGAETHISGAIATAETLGRFTQSSVLTSAYYWTYPPNESPTYWAFRAYRNYDGNGGHFLDEALATRTEGDVSLFASRDSGRERMVLVAVNKSPTESYGVTTQLEACGAQKSLRTFRFSELSPKLEEQQRRAIQIGAPLTDVLPPNSITVYELR